MGAGTGFLILKEALQAYFMQQLLGDYGMALTATLVRVRQVMLPTGSMSAGEFTQAVVPLP